MKAPEYTEEQRAFFAEFAERRAQFAADECTHSERCWVTHGPPSLMEHNGCREACVGCGGVVARRYVVKSSALVAGAVGTGEA